MTRRLSSPRPALVAAALVLAGTGALPAASASASPVPNVREGSDLRSSASAPTAVNATPRAGDKPDVRLRKDPKGPVRSTSVQLDSQSALGRGSTVATISRRMKTTTFTMVALTWRGGSPETSVRLRKASGWGRWLTMEPLTDLPSRNAGEGNGRRGTELRWVGPASGVQVRTRGNTQGLRLELINPGRLASDKTAKPLSAKSESKSSGAGSKRARTLNRATTKGAPRPDYFSRRTWKPNESWKNGTVSYEKTIKQVHIHHTATANGYSKAEVPGIIRGMYRYHTKSLGWFDLGYNFLVDRFGRSWVGRSGGAPSRVRGAHTLGFNANSTGIAVIGNYQSVRPPMVVLYEIIRLAAWKLDKDGNPAAGKVSITSEGSDKYARGRKVSLPRIDGHRDTNDTACPGTKLYDKLSYLRKRTQIRIDRH